jgi:hypothetical protein
MECLSCKINQLKRNSTKKYIKNMYSYIHEFQKVRDHRTNWVTEQKAEVLVDSHSRKTISVKYGTYKVNTVIQTETHKSEPLVYEPSTFKVEVNSEKFERYKV